MAAYLKDSVSNGKPREPALIRCWWMEEQGSKGLFHGSEPALHFVNARFGNQFLLKVSVIFLLARHSNDRVWVKINRSVYTYSRSFPRIKFRVLVGDSRCNQILRESRMGQVRWFKDWVGKIDSKSYYSS